MKVSIFALFALVIISNLYAQDGGAIKDDNGVIISQDLLYRHDDKVTMPKDLLFRPEDNDFKIILVDSKKEEAKEDEKVEVKKIDPKTAAPKKDGAKKNEPKVTTKVLNDGSIEQTSEKVISDWKVNGKRFRLIAESTTRVGGTSTYDSERNSGEGKEVSASPGVQQTNVVKFAIEF